MSELPPTPEDDWYQSDSEPAAGGFGTPPPLDEPAAPVAPAASQAASKKGGRGALWVVVVLLALAVVILLALPQPKAPEPEPATPMAQVDRAAVLAAEVEALRGTLVALVVWTLGRAIAPPLLSSGDALGLGAFLLALPCAALAVSWFVWFSGAERQRLLDTMARQARHLSRFVRSSRDKAGVQIHVARTLASLCLPEDKLIGAPDTTRLGAVLRPIAEGHILPSWRQLDRAVEDANDLLTLEQAFSARRLSPPPELGEVLKVLRLYIGGFMDEGGAIAQMPGWYCPDLAALERIAPTKHPQADILIEQAGFAHLRARRGGDERAGEAKERRCIFMVKVLMQINPRSDIAPLIRSTNLQSTFFFFVEVIKIIGLQKHIGKLSVGDSLFSIFNS